MKTEPVEVPTRARTPVKKSDRVIEALRQGGHDEEAEVFRRLQEAGASEEQIEWAVRQALRESKK